MFIIKIYKKNKQILYIIYLFILIKFLFIIIYLFIYYYLFIIIYLLLYIYKNSIINV